MFLNAKSKLLESVSVRSTKFAFIIFAPVLLTLNEVEEKLNAVKVFMTPPPPF